MMRLTFAAVAALAGVSFGPTAQAYEAPWCAVIELSKGSAILGLPISLVR